MNNMYEAKKFYPKVELIWAELLFCTRCGLLQYKHMHDNIDHYILAEVPWKEPCTQPELIICDYIHTLQFIKHFELILMYDDAILKM